MHRKFNLNNRGNTESMISLELLDILDVIDVNIFSKNYKISNFFRGKFFIKRLIKKVFKYKIQQSMNWNDDFWNNIEILNYKAAINFSERIDNLTEFENEFLKNFSSKRIKNIYKIKKMINNNIQLDSPLFISSNSLNLLGSKISKNNLYMLDGSRRCIAYILNDISEIQIYVIMLKKL